MQQVFQSKLTKSFFSFHYLKHFSFSIQTQKYHLINYEQKGSVGLIQFNRPQKFNAMCNELTHEVNDILAKLDADDSIGAIVVTGHKDFFASGADIIEMKDETYPGTYMKGLHDHWNFITSIKKPIIGAVSGYVLGGGCIYALLCDILLAGHNAKIGIPAIALSITPLGSSTQSLPHLVGKSKAMEIVLTGNPITAEEAHKIGMVSHVYHADEVVNEAVKLGEKISQYSRPVVRMAKECVNKSFDYSLSDGLKYEKQMFWSTFALKDQKEGMNAFVEKRKPKFTNS